MLTAGSTPFLEMHDLVLSPRSVFRIEVIEGDVGSSPMPYFEDSARTNRAPPNPAVMP